MSQLQKRSVGRRYFYRFQDPLLQPYVILKGLADGQVDEDLLEELQTNVLSAPPNELRPPS